MHRHTVIATYTATTETRSVYVRSDGPTAETPSWRSQVPVAATRARRGLFAALAALVRSAIKVLIGIIA